MNRLYRFEYLKSYWRTLRPETHISQASSVNKCIVMHKFKTAAHLSTFAAH
jgi:hypothetical protein